MSRIDQEGDLLVDALILTQPMTVQLKTFALRAARDRVVVRVELCGLCTPEQRVYRGSRPTYPYWGGHELSAIVEYVPPEIETELAVGARVAVGLMDRCGSCIACRSGRDNHCAYIHRGKPDGLPPGPRGLSTRMALPPYKLFPVPESVPAEMAALAEPIACVSRSVERARPSPGEYAAVVGGGTMGLLHTVLLTLKGCQVSVFDDDADTHEKACRAGAVTVGPLEMLSSSKGVRSITGGWGFDVCFCTRFGARGISMALSSAARDSRIVLFQSVPDEDEVLVHSNFVHYHEIQLIGSVAQTSGDLSRAVNLLAANLARFGCLEIETLPAFVPEKAFERALGPKINRVLVDFRNGTVAG